MCWSPAKTIGPKATDARVVRPMEPPIDSVCLPRLLADATLGRLSKWLRMAGIDVAWDPSIPDAIRLKRLADANRRWVLTRSRKVFEALGPDRCLLVKPDEALEQVLQVIQHFGITRDDLRPLSRCTLCNRQMSEVSKPSIVGQVPDYVWQQHEQFMTCFTCQRIYWRGSHTRRIHAMFDHWFQ